jgi:hypothetical protein
MTYVELALDTIMPDEQSCWQLRDLFDNHYVQRWHGKRETRLFIGAGGRTAKGRSRGITLSWYDDRPSKITGETPCFHLEAQVQGSGAIRRLGINHPRDLLSLDHAALWGRQLTGCFFTVNVERLYRTWENRHRKTKRRKPDIDKNGRNRDAAKGAVLFRACGSVQAVVDQIGRGRFLCKWGRIGHPGSTSWNIKDFLSLSPEICYPYRTQGGRQ